MDYGTTKQLTLLTILLNTKWLSKLLEKRMNKSFQTRIPECGCPGLASPLVPGPLGAMCVNQSPGFSTSVAPKDLNYTHGLKQQSALIHLMQIFPESTQ